MKSHIEIALLLPAPIDIVVELRCGNPQQLLDAPLEALEVWIVLHLAAILADLLLESLDVGGRVCLHLLHKLHALVLGPGEADLLPIIPTRHTSVHIQVVIRDNAQDDVGSRDALSSLCGHEFPGFLDLCIDILLADAAVG